MADPQPRVSKRYVFLDSCIVQAAGSKKKTKSEIVLNYLEELVGDGYSLAISEITLYENLHGLWGSRVSTAMKLMKSYEWKVISNQVLGLASILGGLYHEEKYEGIEVGDKIIAATAILETGYVLTENYRDFPYPFFLVERSIPLTYHLGQIKRTMDLTLYKPNLTFVARKLEEKENLK